MITIPISLDPVLFSLGPFQLGWHGIFTAIALVAGLHIGVHRAVSMGMIEISVQRVAYWGVAGGIIGARVFHVLDHLPTYTADPIQIFAIWSGGIAVYGGFVGGIIAGAIVARREGLARWPLADAAAPGLLAGQAIGRVGCLLNGDAWGAPCQCLISLVYTNPGALIPADLLGVPTQPYPLYEIAGVALVLLAIKLGARFFQISGSTFMFSVFTYSAIRFGFSYMRQETVLLWGLQEAQLIAIGTAAIAGLLFIAQRRGVAPAVSS